MKVLLLGHFLSKTKKATLLAKQLRQLACATSRILFLFVFSFSLTHAQDTLNTKQLLVVTTQDWSTPTGKLQRYERHDYTWKKVGKEIDIILGRNGLGWGLGLHTIPKEAKYVKREGDGKAPAGIFKLKQAFGYAPFDIHYPYAVYDETDHCVDDIDSMLYNKIVDSTQINVDYKSHERMKFPKDYYKYGIVVDHNGIAEGEKSVRGAGSCIFIHIKKIPTSGCTVMNESEIKEVLRWLSPKAVPLLVQGTKKVVSELLKEKIQYFNIGLLAP